MFRVLVTGVGAVIGYGILRSLRQTQENFFLLGADIYADAVGQAWSDTFEQAPLTSDPAYPDWLSSVLTRHAIDLVFPGIEQDVHFYSDHRDLFEKTSTKCVLNAKPLIDFSKDKWLMDQELARIGSQVRIPSFIQGNFSFLAATLGLPFLMKPRRSYASKGIVTIRAEADFERHAARLGEYYLAQPIIGSDKEEYTVAVFGNGHGETSAAIAMRRELAPAGSTAKAWVRDEESLLHEAKALCHHFQAVGPTNMQFRKDGASWKLLEINPRISSATSLRTAFGYNEALMSVRFYEGKPVVQPEIQPGFAVRYIEDFIVHDRDHF